MSKGSLGQLWELQKLSGQGMLVIISMSVLKQTHLWWRGCVVRLGGVVLNGKRQGQITCSVSAIRSPHPCRSRWRQGGARADVISSEIGDRDVIACLPNEVFLCADRACKPPRPFGCTWAGARAALTNLAFVLGLPSSLLIDHFTELLP